MSATEQAELAMLTIFKSDALERMADDERVITAQRERIIELERVLKRTRCHIYDIYTSTVWAVLPKEAAAKPRAARPKRKAAA